MRAETRILTSQRDDTAIDAACQKLRSWKTGERIAAAKLLEKVGDERAIEPLCECIREQFVGGSIQRSRRWRTVRITLTALAVLGSVTLLFLASDHPERYSTLWGLAFGAFVVFMILTPVFVLRERDPGPDCLPMVVTALHQIALRHPSTQARQIVPELRSLAESKRGRNPISRKTLTQAARTADLIEASTDAIHNLPLPEQAPFEEALPRPTESTFDHRDDLPLPG